MKELNAELKRFADLCAKVRPAKWLREQEKNQNG